MRESFNEYKQLIETNIFKFTYLYDGDVLSSYNDNYSCILKHSQVSPISIIDCIVHIYNKSIERMIDNSEEIVITKSKLFVEIDTYLDVVNFSPMYIFCSKNGLELLGYSSNLFNTHPFPSYLSPVKSFLNKSYDLYFSHLIKDQKDDVHIYMVDKSIQSLVYGIQNMDYYIEQSGDDDYKHIIDYKFYECDFNCCKLTVRDISRIREDKIKQILE